MDKENMSRLAALLDLPPSYGGTGLYLLERAADEVFLGAFAGITASFISFCRKRETRAYIEIAEALEDFAPPQS